MSQNEKYSLEPQTNALRLRAFLQSEVAQTCIQCFEMILKLVVKYKQPHILLNCSSLFTSHSHSFAYIIERDKETNNTGLRAWPNGHNALRLKAFLLAGAMKYKQQHLLLNCTSVFTHSPRMTQNRCRKEGNKKTNNLGQEAQTNALRLSAFLEARADTLAFI